MSPAPQRPLAAFISLILGLWGCGNPVSPDIDDAALEAIAEQVDRWAADSAVVGAELLIVKNGNVALHHVAGWKDREAGIPMVPHTVFSIASMTKPILSTAVLMLIEEGKIALDDHVSTFLPSFDNDRSRAITVEQLLTRTAGFTQPGFPANIGTYGSLREAVDAAGLEGPAAPPGTVFARTQAGSGTLGALVEEVSGLSAEEFFATRIVEPLGMSENTLMGLPRNHPLRTRVATQYLKDEDGSFFSIWDNNDPDPFPYFLASSGVYTTAAEYVKFLEMWLNLGVADGARLVNEGLMLRGLVVEPLSADDFVPYGLHMEINVDPGAPESSTAGVPRSFGHRGATGTIGWVVPAEGLIGVYFTQSAGGTTHHEIPFVVRNALGKNE